MTTLFIALSALPIILVVIMVMMHMRAQARYQSEVATAAERFLKRMEKVHRDIAKQSLSTRANLAGRFKVD